MDTKILKMNEKQGVKAETKQILEQVGQVLKQGGLVAFPTETVYGLGADALNEDAARKTYEAKGRPSDNPLIVHIADLEKLDGVVEQVSEKAKQMAETFWPGPLTMVFPKSEVVPYGTTGGLETVAVRMPDHELAREIIRIGGGYISAPSANSSGRPSPTSAHHVAEDLRGKIHMIVDGGEVKIGVESTILDMTVEPPMILRPGAITQEMIEAVIGTIHVDQTLLKVEDNVAPKAPGMKYKHYAPKADLQIVVGKDMIAGIQGLVAEKAALGKLVGVIATEESKIQYQQGLVKSIGSRKDMESIAHNLYKILREFDEEDVEYIYSESFYGDGMGHAIMNRLMKAAGHHVIEL